MIPAGWPMRSSAPQEGAADQFLIFHGICRLLIQGFGSNRTERAVEGFPCSSSRSGALQRHLPGSQEIQIGRTPRHNARISIIEKSTGKFWPTTYDLLSTADGHHFADEFFFVKNNFREPT
jgi:hypothetical protein